MSHVPFPVTAPPPSGSGPVLVPRTSAGHKSQAPLGDAAVAGARGLGHGAKSGAAAAGPQRDRFASVLDAVQQGGESVDVASVETAAASGPTSACRPCGDERIDGNGEAVHPDSAAVIAPLEAPPPAAATCLWMLIPLEHATTHGDVPAHNHDDPTAASADPALLAAASRHVQQTALPAGDGAPHATATDAHGLAPTVVASAHVAAEHAPIESASIESASIEHAAREYDVSEHAAIEHAPIAHAPIEHVVIEHAASEHGAIEQAPVEHPAVAAPALLPHVRTQHDEPRRPASDDLRHGLSAELAHARTAGMAHGLRPEMPADLAVEHASATAAEALAIGGDTVGATAAPPDPAAATWNTEPARSAVAPEGAGTVLDTALARAQHEAATAPLGVLGMGAHTAYVTAAASPHDTAAASKAERTAQEGAGPVLDPALDRTAHAATTAAGAAFASGGSAVHPAGGSLPNDRPALAWGTGTARSGPREVAAPAPDATLSGANHEPRLLGNDIAAAAVHESGALSPTAQSLARELAGVRFTAPVSHTEADALRSAAVAAADLVPRGAPAVASTLLNRALAGVQLAGRPNHTEADAPTLPALAAAGLAPLAGPATPTTRTSEVLLRLALAGEPTLGGLHDQRVHVSPLAAALTPTPLTLPDASVAATPPAVPLPAAVSEQVTAHIISSLKMQWKDGVGEAKLQLRPDAHGSITVALRVQDGAVTAVVRAESPQVQEWVLQHQQTLRQQLEAAGLHLDDLSVTPDGQQGQRQQQDASRDARRQLPKRSAQDADEPRRFESLL